MKRGFTLVELLVVIAIIGILSSIVIVNLSSSRERARDARRKEDLNSIRTALELYANSNNGQFPAALANLAPDYFNETPKDPKTKLDYIYSNAPCGGGAANQLYYRIMAILERGSTSDLKECDGSNYYILQSN